MNSGESTSERAESLVDEVGDQLADLETQYRTARSAIADEDLNRRRESEDLFESPIDRQELVHRVVALTNEQRRLAEELSARDSYVKALREQIDELELRIARSVDADERLAEVSERLTASEAQAREDRREAERLGMLVDARTIERDEISASARALEVEKVELRRAVDTMGEELDTLRLEREDFRKQLHRVETQVARERREHEQITVEFEAENERREGLNKTIADLNRRVAADADRRSENEALLERRDSEIKHLKRVAERTGQELDETRPAVDALKERTEERDRLQKRVESLESALAAQTTEAGASKKALELLAARTAERDQLEQRVGELEELLADVSGSAETGRVASENLETRTAERDYLDQRVAELEQRIHTLQTQNQRWREEAAMTAELVAERDELRGLLDELEREVVRRGPSQDVAAVDEDDEDSDAPDDSELARADEAAETAPPAGEEEAEAETAPPAEAEEPVVASGLLPPDLGARISTLETRMQDQFGRATTALSESDYDRGAAMEAVKAAVAAAVQMRESLESAADHLLHVAEGAPEPTPVVDGSSAHPSVGGGARYRVVVARDDPGDPATDVGEATPAPVWAEPAAAPAAPAPAVSPPVISAPAVSPPVLSAPAAAVPAAQPLDAPPVVSDPADQERHVITAEVPVVVDPADFDYQDPVLAEPRVESAPVSAPTIAPATEPPVATASSATEATAFRGAIDEPTSSPEAEFWGADLDVAVSASRETESVDLLAQPVEPEAREEILALYSDALAGMETDATPKPAVTPVAKKKRGRRRGRKRIKLPSHIEHGSPEAAAYLLGLRNVMVLVDGESAAARGWEVGPGLSPADHLVNGLSHLAARTDASFEVVFDGDRTQITPSLVSRSRVRVRFARGGVSVIDVVTRLTDAFPSTQPVVAASSNQRMRDALRKTRVNVVSAGQLCALIKS